MEQDLKIYKFAFWKEWQNFSEVTEKFNVEETFDEKELLQWISKERSCLVFLGINTKDDLVKASVIVKGLRGLRSVQVRLVAVNFSGDRKFDPVFAKLGLQDVLELSVPAKTLKTKIDLWGKSLVRKDLGAEKKLTTKDSKRGEKESVFSQDKVKWVDSLTVEDDIWLVKNDLDCMKILGRWSVKFIGPGPFVGTWEEKSTGRWDFKITGDTKELLLPDEGVWSFEGDQKPEFIWADNKWQAVGRKFRLFYKTDKGELEKFGFQEKALFVAKDSAFAKEKESIFLETFDKSIHVKKTADVIENDEVESETEKLENLKGKSKTDVSKEENLDVESTTKDPWLQNLEGKGKTEHIDQPDLEGKVSTEDLSSPLLDHEAKNRDQWQDNLTGKGKTDSIDAPPLSNEGDWTDDLSSPLLDTEGNTRDQWQQDLDGKGKTENIQAPPLSNKKPVSSEDAKNDLDGDIENPEDFNQVEKYYKGGNGIPEEDESSKKDKLRSSQDDLDSKVDKKSEQEDKARREKEIEVRENNSRERMSQSESSEMEPKKRKDKEASQFDDLSDNDGLSEKEKREEKLREEQEKQIAERKARLERDRQELKKKIEQDKNKPQGGSVEDLLDEEEKRQKEIESNDDTESKRHKGSDDAIDGYLRSPESAKEKRKKKAGYDFSAELEIDDEETSRDGHSDEDAFSEASRGRNRSKQRSRSEREKLDPAEKKRRLKEAIEEARKNRTEREVDDFEDLDFEADDFESLEKILEDSESEVEESELEDSDDGGTLYGQKKKSRVLGEFKLPLLAPVSYLKTSENIYKAQFEDYFDGQLITNGAFSQTFEGEMNFKLVFDYCGKELELNLVGEGINQDGEYKIKLRNESVSKIEKMLPLFEELQMRLDDWISRVKGL